MIGGGLIQNASTYMNTNTNNNNNNIDPYSRYSAMSPLPPQSQPPILQSNLLNLRQHPSSSYFSPSSYNGSGSIMAPLLVNPSSTPSKSLNRTNSSGPKSPSSYSTIY